MSNILTKTINQELSLAEFIYLKFIDKSYDAVSLKLDDNTVLNFNLCDGLRGIKPTLYLDDVHLISEIGLDEPIDWEYTKIPEIPEAVAIAKW